MHSLNLVLLALVLTGLTGCRKNEEPPVESRAPISVVINSFQKLDFSEGAEQNRSESIEFDHLDELLEKLRSLETESSDFRYEIEIAIHKVSRADARIRIVTTSSTAQFQYFPDVDEPGNFTNIELTNGSEASTVASIVKQAFDHDSIEPEETTDTGPQSGDAP